MTDSLLSYTEKYTCPRVSVGAELAAQVETLTCAQMPISQKGTHNAIAISARKPWGKAIQILSFTLFLWI